MATYKGNIRSFRIASAPYRRPEDATFLGELVQVQCEHPTYKLVATMTQIEKSKQRGHGKTGYINREMLVESVGPAAKPTRALCGKSSFQLA